MILTGGILCSPYFDHSCLVLTTHNSSEADIASFCFDIATTENGLGGSGTNPVNCGNLIAMMSVIALMDFMERIAALSAHVDSIILAMDIRSAIRRQESVIA